MEDWQGKDKIFLKDYRTNASYQAENIYSSTLSKSVLLFDFILYLMSYLKGES